jgi:hypothetical protein
VCVCVCVCGSVEDDEEMTCWNERFYILLGPMET